MLARLNKLKDWLSTIWLVRNLLKPAAQWAVQNSAMAAAVGIGSIGMVAGVSGQVQLNNLKDDSAAQGAFLQEIQETGDDTKADLEALEKRIAERIAAETRAQAESLRATAETLEGNLRQTALDAAISLDTEADRLDGTVEVTNETLQESVNLINETIAAVEKASEEAIAEAVANGEEADSAITLNVIDLNAAREAEIAVLQTQNAGLPPIGSVAWVVDETLIDPAHYLNCDGTDINGNILPNVNADNLFVRGGTFDGVSNPDTTAVNGLALNTNVLTNRVGISGGPNPAWFADTPGTVALAGDTETSPVNFRLTCVVRYE